MTARTLLGSAILCLLISAASHAAVAKQPSNRQWEPEIRAFEAADRANPPPRDAILFIGSSTIRLWKTLAQDFPEYKVLNRGFGGCQIADCTYYVDRIVVPYKPRMIVLRAGVNDIAAGKTPEQVRDDFRAFVEKVRAKLPGTRIAYLTINATPARWANVNREKKANQLIEDYIAKGENLAYIDTFAATLGADGKPRAELFVQDRMHFNAEGYKILASAVRKYLPKATANTQLPDAFAQNQRLGRGVNVLGYDPIWKDRQKARFQEKYFRLIKAIKEAGFNHVRVNLHPFRDAKLGADNKPSAS